MNLTREIQQRGGLAATHQLLSVGATSHMLTAAVRAGYVLRVRQGWYALPTVDHLSAEAVRVGGRLTCISGARLHGLWVADSPRLHVRVGRHDSRLRTPNNYRTRVDLANDSRVHVHWGAKDASGTRFSLLPRECLRDMVWCQSPERVIAAADSAIRAGKLSASQWMRDIATLPRALRRLLSQVDARSESILESIVRFRLVQLGFHPQLQVAFWGVGRVDLLLGTLVIELDGWEFHKTREQFEEDRRRDALLAARGYRVLRFTYRQIARQWHEVLGAIRGALA